MDPLEALRHIRVLIDAAGDTDDPETLHKLIRNMRVIVNKAIPRRSKPRLKRSGNVITIKRPR